MSTEMINCEACGSPMRASDRFCPECGHSNSNEVAVAASMSRSEEESEQPDIEDVSGTATTSEAPEAEPAAQTVFSTEEETEREVESPMQAEAAESSETRAESIFSTPMAPPSFTEEVSTQDAAPETGFEMPSSETRRVESSTYSDTPPTGAPTVNIGQQGSTPPSGWQSEPYGAGDAPPSPPPPYSPYPLGQGETPQPEAGGYTAPQYTPPQYTPPQYTPTQDLGQYGGQAQPPTQGYGQGYPAPPGYQYGYGRPVAQPRDPTIALLLELIGYAGFLGIGHIYGGRVSRGIALMVGGWVYIAAATLLIIVLVGCIMWLAWLAIPIASGLWIRSELEKENAGMRYR